MMNPGAAKLQPRGFPALSNQSVKESYEIYVNL